MKRLFLVLACACGVPAPPRTISVSPELPEHILIGVATARDAWCSAPVGWCPELVDYGGESIVAVEHFEVEGKDSSGLKPRMNNVNGYIQISPVIANDPTWPWSGMCTHEFGHYGIPAHLSKSPLMKAAFGLNDPVPIVVDSVAASAWCTYQGC